MKKKDCFRPAPGSEAYLPSPDRRRNVPLPFLTDLDACARGTARQALHLVSNLLELPYILRKPVKPDGAAY